jgi:hypothetical protein
MIVLAEWAVVVLFCIYLIWVHILFRETLIPGWLVNLAKNLAKSSLFKNIKEKAKELSEPYVSKIPGTRIFHINCQKRIVKRVRMRLRLFRKLRILDAQKKRHLTRRIRFAEKQLSVEIVSGEIAVEVVSSLAGLVSFLWLFIGSTITIAFWSKLSYSLNTWGIVWATSLPMAMVLRRILMIPAMIESRRSYLTIPIWVKSSWFYIVISLCAMFFQQIVTIDFSLQDDTFLLSFVIALFSILGYVFLYFVIFALGDLILYWHQRKRYSDLKIIDNLLLIMVNVENNPTKWTRPDFRKNLLQELEETARFFENDLFYRLQSGSVITDSWTRDRMSSIAAAVRELQKWMITPKLDTREYFLGRISKLFVDFVEGNWDSLPQAEPERLQSSRRWQLYVAKLLRVLVTGLSPLLIFCGIQRTTIAFTGPIVDYVTVWVFMWAILSFFTEIEPRSIEKMKVIKDIVPKP